MGRGTVGPAVNTRSRGPAIDIAASRIPFEGCGFVYPAGFTPGNSIHRLNFDKVVKRAAKITKSLDVSSRFVFNTVLLSA